MVSILKEAQAQFQRVIGHAYLVKQLFTKGALCPLGLR